MKITNLLATAVGLAGLLAASARAQETLLFSENFDADISAPWNVFDGSGTGVADFTAEFNFDYSTLGIPAAPNSTGGTTRGVKFTINNNDDVADVAGVSAYPAGQSFSGDYALRVDMWMGYNGPAFGGTGSTEYGLFGINHAGNKATWDDATLADSDGVWFAVTGEAGTGSTGDYRAYEGLAGGPPFRLGLLDAGFLDRDGDGARENEVNPTQSLTFPLKAILPAPPGETPGAPGKQWVEVEVRQRGGEVTWLINGFVIASRSNLSGFDSGNIMLGTMDVFASIADPREQNFTLFDNVRVVNLTGVAALPVVEITSEDAEAAEPGTDSASFTLRRTGDTAQPLTVNLHVGGSATSGSDYEAISASVAIPAGQESVTVTVQPLNDALGEGDEDIIVALAPGAGYEVRERVAVQLVVKDDGDVPVASIRAVRGVAYELNPRRVGLLAVELNSPGVEAIAVPLEIGGTAVAGTHYETIPTSVTFAAGETNANVSIVPRNDAEVNPDRTVVVTLGAGAGYVLAEAPTATVLIRNDDLPPGKATAFTENFDADHTGSWTVNQGPGDGVAEFFFDYSTVGIPAAPNSAGTTRGLKLQANLTSGVFGGLSVSPTGQAFAGDYRLRFDLWQNFNGPLPAGGNGSTQITGAGVGTLGTVPQWPGGTQDSVWFAATADGGSGVDYRAYSSVAPGGYGDTSGVFPAGGRNESNAYYGEFGEETAPTAQVDLYPDQAGTTLRGAQGFQWRDVVITQQGGKVTWHVDGLLLATVPLTGETNVTLGGANIHFMYSDINAGSSSDPNAPATAFGLVDNVRVELIEAAVVEPPVVNGIKVADGLVRIRFTGPGEASQFVVAGAAELTSAFTPESGVTIQSTGPNQFEATVGVNGAARFYRVGR